MPLNRANKCRTKTLSHPAHVRHNALRFANRDELIAFDIRVLFHGSPGPVDRNVCHDRRACTEVQARAVARVIAGLAQTLLHLNMSPVADEYAGADAATI